MVKSHSHVGQAVKLCQKKEMCQSSFFLSSIWPGASLSSFEHGGRWKLANYFAMKFFRPVIVSVNELVRGLLRVFIVNDLPGTSMVARILVSVRRFDQVDTAWGGESDLGNVEVGERTAELVKTLKVRTNYDDKVENIKKFLAWLPFKSTYDYIYDLKTNFIFR